MSSSTTSAARKKPPPAASPLGYSSADESSVFYGDHRRQSFLPSVPKTFPVRSTTAIPRPRSPVPFLIRDLFLAKKGAQELNPQASSPSSSSGSVILPPPLPPSDGGAEDSTTFFTARASDATTVASSVGEGYGGFRRYKISDAADVRRSEEEYDYADDECSSSSCRSSLSGIDGCSRGGGGPNKPHKANDSRWEAIRFVRRCEGPIGLSHFRLLQRLGHGDIGTVYLAKLSRTGNLFAMKVMDKAQLVSRNKLVRAQTEKDILHALDHPFLPTLYTDFETDRYSCLVMEYCPGGDLHTLRQKQPGRRFGEQAARFYVAEVLLALEYLHMLGIIYRDLKPENVLVREDGHIMLSDFDLSLRCAVFPMLVHTTEMDLLLTKNPTLPIEPSCIAPTCLQPTCFSPRCIGVGRSKSKKAISGNLHRQDTPFPELIAEPTNARSMSFVGTHEYLAPEIIKGEGHGSSVDWWTFGIFLYELLFGTTPFKGSQNRATLFNVIGEPLKFPEKPAVSFAARDLIRRLLEKEPQQRLGFKHGAAEIKQHPFFRSINWALIRCKKPPQSPKRGIIVAGGLPPVAAKDLPGVDLKSSGQYLDMEF